MQNINIWFTHVSAGEHLVISYVCLLWIMLLWIFGWTDTFTALRYIFRGENAASSGHSVLTFWRTAKLVSHMAALFSTPISNIEVSCFSTFSPTLSWSVLKYFWHLQCLLFSLFRIKIVCCELLSFPCETPISKQLYKF